MSPEEATEIAWKFVRRVFGDVKWRLWTATRRDPSEEGKWLVMFDRSTKDELVEGAYILLVDDRTGEVKVF